MMHNRHEKSRVGRGNLAAILVDYENLFATLSERLDETIDPHDFISEILDELLRYLNGKDYAQTAFFTAYADFATLKGQGLAIQQALYRKGLEPRYVSTDLHAGAAELQLCVDAMELLHTRPDIQSFVLITGNRVQLPLVQQLTRHGRSPLVVVFEPEPDMDRFARLDADVILAAADLISDAARRQLGAPSQAPGAARSGGHPRRAPSTPLRDATHHAVTDAVAYRTLEVIEEFFGQYEEVYLTPLLRKLSEALDSDEPDPKSVINKLEEAGAVWLEKRRGFPYDYTVLIVDRDHPDVRQIAEALSQREPFGEEYDGGEAFASEGDAFDEEFEYTDPEFDAPEDDFVDDAREPNAHGDFRTGSK
ncbi:MAG: NYN domain-containing protein [Rhodothermales bacterium]|nr:NYN domain-containing protein [Rhodothermales bacterium]